MKDNPISELKVGFERDSFLRTLLYHLSGALQDTIGLEDSRGYISFVGQVMGDEMYNEYKKALSVEKIPNKLLSSVLVDLKQRIQGQFYVIHEDENKIVFGNKRCPFAEKVIGRPSLCMMTTNVFGRIAAETNGYAKVSIDKAIATNDTECQVTVYLNAEHDDSLINPGKEFFSG